MELEEQEEFADMVAQAVIDRMEERGKVSRIVELVTARVMDLQRQEAALRAETQSSTSAETNGTVMERDGADNEQ